MKGAIEVLTDTLAKECSEVNEIAVKRGSWGAIEMDCGRRSVTTEL